MRGGSPEIIRPEIVEQSRRRFVRFDHEHFDDRVTETRVLRLGTDDATIVIEN